MDNNVLEVKTAQASADSSNKVMLVDVKMPFWSMVVFMVKAAIASIPAAIILAIIWLVVASVIGGMVSGLAVR